MNISKFVKGFGVFALALSIIAPSVVLAQSALVASIDAPVDGAEFEVGETIQFNGSASGGSGSYTYAWTWGDGTGSAGQDETHSYNTVGSKTVTFEVQDQINTTSEATDTITIDIVADSGECNPLIIEEGNNTPRATNVTKTSATIVWETCEESTSRVIYDTVSNPDITDDSAPNYGYQWSTSKDNNKVIQHSVELTGLTSNTTYYFRVLSER